MTRTLIGLDYAGVPAVKITRGTYDPATTPDSMPERFYFNSKFSTHAMVLGFFSSTYEAYSGSATVVYDYLPSGTGPSNALRARKRGVGSGLNKQQHDFIYRAGWFGSLAYTTPMFDVRWKRPSDGHYIHAKRVRVLQGYTDGTGQTGGYWQNGFGQAEWQINNTNADQTTPIPLTSGYFCSLLGSGLLTENNPEAGCDNQIILYDLPGDGAARIGNPGAPVAGARVVEISASQCRVAKPGYDVRTATAQQLAFDANAHPAKVIASADIPVPVGTSSYDTGIALPANVVADVHVYEGSVIYSPMSPDESELGLEYWFSGTRIYFSNAYRACRARFIIIADDDSSPSSGSNQVLRQFADGAEQVVQFLRPGAAASPTLSDIVLDSRWPCLQILASGFLAVTSGDQVYTVNFDGSGYFPFVKMLVRCTEPANSLRPAYNFYRPPQVRRLRLSGGVGGNTTYAQLSANQCIFRTFVGRPVSRHFDEFGNIVQPTDRTPVNGLRYYIFGIPI